MWTYEHSIEAGADPAIVHRLLTDAATWPEWNSGVERIDMEGPFAAGTWATMHLPGQEALRFRLVWVEAGRGFEDETPIPGTDVVVRVRHALEPLDGGRTRVTYACSIDGIGADELGPEFGPAITGDFPDVMAALAARAEALARAG